MCPNCKEPNGDRGKFKLIRTMKFKDQIIRGYVCPTCNRSFKTIEKPIDEPFYKRDSIGHK